MGVPEWQEKFKVHPKKLGLMLTEILFRSILIALAVLFIHVSTWEGMINEWVHSVADSWPPWIKKPLFDCPICMSFWWGLLINAIGVGSQGWQPIGLFNAIIMVFAAGGLNAVLIYVISSDKEIVKELKD